MMVILSQVHKTEQKGVMQMYNTSKLKGRIVEKFGSQTAFAAAVHRPKGYISQYMNGKVFLDQRTIDEWANVLEIPGTEICTYFFAK